VGNSEAMIASIEIPTHWDCPCHFVSLRTSEVTKSRDGGSAEANTSTEPPALGSLDSVEPPKKLESVQVKRAVPVRGEVNVEQTVVSQIKEAWRL
jgi:hypothetical protein